MNSVLLISICFCLMTLMLGCEDPASNTHASALFAGGCFWGVEHQLQQLPGVQSVTSGYTGGHTANPTYTQVCSGETGHAECVEVVYDPATISYAALARRFFEIHDPTTLNRQGPDKGTQYRSAIYYRTAEEQAAAKALIAQLRTNGYDVVTELAEASPFYPAEAYHQDYFETHPGHGSCHFPVLRFDTPAK
ncbi:MAG: peptide-methionine (S)-S-oxide reductase MsrA [Phycisphaerales bacterium]|jgi:peptide methionine sulfoxide reductase msrA/msrB|nr:peptide-methionine (S)-S-oxide reductase MsrA [Phycisphaerales bacterium]MBT7170407.1 peptide-methionine (S)-S-oxide reductase MsrA [Phycisphaerales bacterium]